MPIKKDYLRRNYYRLSAIKESIICIFLFLITKNFKLKSYKPFLYKKPISSTIFYNKIGIFLCSLKIFFSYFIPLFKNNIFYLSTKENLSNKSLFKDDNKLWPIPKMCKIEEDKDLEKETYDKLLKSYKMYYLQDDKKLPRGEWWQNYTDNFSNIFFEKNLEEINKFNLKNLFKVKSNVDLIQAHSFLAKGNRLKKFFRIAEVIGNYHDLYDIICPEILINSSESKIFDCDAIIYRNQLLTDRLIRCIYYLSQIKKNTDLQYDQRFIFLDLGGGYGCLTRLILNLFHNSKGILIDLPETCLLASYYLTKNFPNKKIKYLCDIKMNEKLDNKFFENTDLLIIPTTLINLIPDHFVDLVINTASLGEMSIEYGEFYMKNINRITKKYFYSHNRKDATDSIWDGYGHYKYEFEGKWKTKLYNFSPGWHLEFLGEIEK